MCNYCLQMSCAMYHMIMVYEMIMAQKGAYGTPSESMRLHSDNTSTTHTIEVHGHHCLCSVFYHPIRYTDFQVMSEGNLYKTHDL